MAKKHFKQLKQNILKKIGQHNHASIKFHLIHRPALAARETRRALVLLKKFEKILDNNLMIFELNDFLLGNSSITRRLKKKK